MLREEKGKKRTVYVPDYCLYDLETTGVSVTTDQIVEIGAVKVRQGRVVEEFSTLVNPGIPMPAAASQVNGITDEMLKDAPGIEEALEDFLDFVQEDVLVGHNIHSFDMRFLYRECERIYGKTLGNDYVDTLSMARRLLPDLGTYSLSALDTYYGVTIKDAHRALADCLMNQEVYERLGQETPPKDVLLCPKCSEPLVRRKGKYGEFYGCSGYPNCRYTQNIR